MKTQEAIDLLKSSMTIEQQSLFEDILDTYTKRITYLTEEDMYDISANEYDLPLGKVFFYTTNLSYQQRLESYITKTLDNTQCDLAAKKFLTRLRQF